jgi:folate-binding protein YgfZ
MFPDIGHTRHRKHWAYNTQETLGIQDTCNIGHTRHRKHWAYKTQVTLATSEKFIPQDLNLDIEEVGVSFTKGCYPGQEVIFIAVL